MTIGVTAPLTALATAGIKYNATMETYLANLTTLLGGNEQAAQELLDTLREMANTTPYEATDLVKATQKMMAFGISAQDSLKYLQMLGDIAMGDANKMDSLTLAFSQISASGRATMEDINQMIDQGFNPLTIVAQKTGESMADLRDRVSAGGVSFEEIAGAFETATSEGGIFYQSMDKASQTTEGKISSLKDAFSTALGTMTESLLPFVTSAVDGLSKLANWFSNLDEGGKKLVLTIAGIALAIGPVTTAIGGLISVGAKIKTIVTMMKSWNLVTKAMTAAQWLLNAALNANPIGLVIAAITAVIAAIVLLWNKCEWFRDGVMAVINVVVSFFQNLWSSIVSIASSIWNTIVSIANSIWNVIQTILNYLQVPIDFIKNILLLIVAIVATVLETIYNTVVTIIQSILSFFGTIAGWIYENVLLPVYNFFANIFNAIYNTIASFINTVFSIFSTVANWIYTNVLQPIFNFFSNIFNAIWNVISKVIDNIKNAFQAVGNFIKSVFEGVKSVISTIINTIVNIIKAPINALIGFVNAIIKGLNKIKVPDWVPGIGGMGINIPLIPKLATGTNYVKAEGLAYLHEGEAVVPKKYNPAVGGGTVNSPIIIEIYNDNISQLQLDSKIVAEAVNKYNENREVAV